ncbi:hypothetical protein chiPu_0023916, partial [Chiloscyllium punctatum]|nr:hypothetical protein [Chiloscyllium punctatum]
MQTDPQGDRDGHTHTHRAAATQSQLSSPRTDSNRFSEEEGGGGRGRELPGWDPQARSLFHG